MSEMLAIETSALGRIYKIRGSKKGEQKELVALQDVNLQIQPGELFGLLGPNGAGKTTLIKVLTTLLAPTTGWAKVAGIDVLKNPEAVRQQINMVSGGESSGYGLLTVRENLWMFAQFYGIATDEANRRIKTLLEIVGIADRANTRSSNLSTGLRQKMNIVRGFLTDPQVLFLDEPTLGLDVGAARDVRQFIRRWMDEDRHRTLLLTTHYLVEAEELCDRVAIINKGTIAAIDAPERLKKTIRSVQSIEFSFNRNSPDQLDELRLLPGADDVRKAGDKFKIYTGDPSEVIDAVMTYARSHDLKVISITTLGPSLEDVFIKLTGLERTGGAVHAID